MMMMCLTALTHARDTIPMVPSDDTGSRPCEPRETMWTAGESEHVAAGLTGTTPLAPRGQQDNNGDGAMSHPRLRCLSPLFTHRTSTA